MTEWTDRADDIIIIFLGGVALFFMVFGKKSGMRLPFHPYILFVLAFLVKVGSFFIEHDDARAIGPDYLVLALMLPGLILNGWKLIFARRQQR